MIVPLAKNSFVGKLDLAEHNLVFLGNNDILYTPNSGNFLGQIELLAKFDPVMEDHNIRYQQARNKQHYLSHDIQNEFVKIISSIGKNKLMDKIKSSKYYSVILDCTLDCTPDISHIGQLSLIIRTVQIKNGNVEICDNFCTFLEVDNTNGLGKAELLKQELNNMGLLLSDCRGQGYDNGANMIGEHQGVQTFILNENCIAFYVPCG